MNGRVAKKIQRAAKRNWQEYVREIKKWSFMTRLRYCWYILFGKERR